MYTQQLQLEPHYSIRRRSIAPQMRTRLGAGASQVRRMYERSIYEFVVSDRHATAARALNLWSWAQYYQGDVPFWFDPGGYMSTIPDDSPVLVGYGNGVQTQFYLPNRYLIVDTLQVFVNDVLTAVSVDTATGLITFSSPPADPTPPAITEIRASYSVLYKVVFAVESEILLDEEAFCSALSRFEGIVLREQVP